MQDRAAGKARIVIHHSFVCLYCNREPCSCFHALSARGRARARAIPPNCRAAAPAPHGRPEGLQVVKLPLLCARAQAGAHLVTRSFQTSRLNLARRLTRAVGFGPAPVRAQRADSIDRWRAGPADAAYQSHPKLHTIHKPRLLLSQSVTTSN